MTTANERIRDRTILRGALTEQYKTGEVRDALRYLNRNVYPIVAETVAKRVGLIKTRGHDSGPATTRRLKLLEQELKKLTLEPYQELYRRARDTGTLFGKREAEWMAGAIDEAIEFSLGVPVPVDPVIPTMAQIQSAIVSTPFEGRVLRQHFGKLRGDLINETMAQVRTGLFAGESTEQITRRVTGTRAGEGMYDVLVKTVTPAARADIFVRECRFVWSGAASLTGLASSCLSVRSLPSGGSPCSAPERSSIDDPRLRERKLTR